MTKEEYAVEVKISGRATVFTRATSEEKAMDQVNKGEFYGGDVIEWSAEDAVSAEPNQ